MVIRSSLWPVGHVTDLELGPCLFLGLPLTTPTDDTNTPLIPDAYPTPLLGRMGSAKQETASTKVMNLLHEWDQGSKATRKTILQAFIAQNYNKTGPELEAEFAEAASLFFARLTAWLRLTYMIGTCLTEQLQALQIFLAASSGHKFLSEFLEVGGVLTVLEVLGLKQGREADKTEALKLLASVANAGRKYKELICESYGIRAVAECLAKARSEVTQEAARSLLLSLANGNPKFENQVYKGLIALLPCSSPKAQQMAAQTLRLVQPIVGQANPTMVEPLLKLLKSLHLEVQYEAVELIKLLMDYEVRDAILTGLVGLLRPAKEDLLRRPTILDDASVPALADPLSVFVQQAAAAKCIGSLCRESQSLEQRFIQYFCRNTPIVDEHVREAVGEALRDLFLADPEVFYTKISAVQADILVSNKVNIPGVADQ